MVPRTAPARSAPSGDPPPPVAATGCRYQRRRPSADGPATGPRCCPAAPGVRPPARRLCRRHREREHHRCAGAGPGQAARVLVTRLHAVAGTRPMALRLKPGPPGPVEPPPVPHPHLRRDRGGRPGGDGRCPRRNPNQSQSPHRRRSRPRSRCRKRHSRRPAPLPDLPAPAGYPRISPPPGLNAVSRDLRLCPRAGTRGI